MLFDFFDDRLLLDFSLEASERAFDRFSFFNNDKSQKYSPPCFGVKDFISESCLLVKVNAEKERLKTEAGFIIVDCFIYCGESVYWSWVD
jgi:hypothetical protein